MTFNREVRLGDILNVLGFMAAAAGAWMSVDSRITRVEVTQTAQGAAMGEIRDNIKEIKQDVKDTQRILMTPPERRRSM